ncbi:MAG TPA: recombinase A, partial [Candidatus Binatia bacterium]|nr:recombinase A [Candidatus Binatia bacterium]
LMVFSFAQNFSPSVITPTPWTLAEIAGRFVEISASAGSASLTLVFGLVQQTQQRGEPVGWVTSQESFFYPPDAANRGVDLASLAVIRVLDPASIPRAGEKLLRSGGFGLVVLDLGVVDIPVPLQSRLTGLAQHHHTGLVCLTEKQSKTFSLGSLVSLRAHAERKQISNNSFVCRLRVLKDKRRGPTWSHEELCRGPAGLC